MGVIFCANEIGNYTKSKIISILNDKLNIIN